MSPGLTAGFLVAAAPAFRTEASSGVKGGGAAGPTEGAAMRGSNNNIAEVDGTARRPSRPLRNSGDEITSVRRPISARVHEPGRSCGAECIRNHLHRESL